MMLMIIMMNKDDDEYTIYTLKMAFRLTLAVALITMMNKNGDDDKKSTVEVGESR